MVLALAAAGGPLLAGAQAGPRESAYPDRPIRFIVPLAPGGTPEQCRDIMRSEMDKYGKLVKAAGIKAERGG
jgi:tripartite-type tricarboxylate transporter receptor subunit TctC